MAVAESGKGWFHKPLDYDMCAAILDRKTGREKNNKVWLQKMVLAGTVVTAFLETAETIKTNWNWWSKLRLMELMDEIVASSGLLSIWSLKVMKSSCSCFMVHVRCGVIVLNTASFLLVNTFQRICWILAEEHLGLASLWNNDSFVSLTVFVEGGGVSEVITRMVLK